MYKKTKQNKKWTETNKHKQNKNQIRYKKNDKSKRAWELSRKTGGDGKGEPNDSPEIQDGRVPSAISGLPSGRSSTIRHLLDGKRWGNPVKSKWGVGVGGFNLVDEGLNSKLSSRWLVITILSVCIYINIYIPNSGHFLQITACCNSSTTYC